MQIQNGFRVKCMSLKDLNVFIDDIRNKMEDFHKKEFLKLYAKDITSFIDSMTFFKNIYEDYNGEKIEDYIYKSIKNDNKYDFLFDINIIPIFRKTLGIPFCSNETLIENFKKIDGIYEYGYWDNEKKPEELSSRSWERRKNCWNEALKNKEDKAINGISAHIIDISIPRKESFNFKDYSEYIPSDNERADKIAEKSAINEMYLELSESGQSDQAYDKAVWYIKEHRELVLPRIADILDKLPDISEKFIKEHIF